jgi:hypothetical protein
VGNVGLDHLRSVLVTERIERRARALGSFGLPKAPGNPMPHTLIVSLCTIRARLGCVHKTIESLLRQDLVPDAVHLYISPEPYLLDEGIEPADLPPALTRLRDAGLLQIRTTPNTGSLRKLRPALQTALESSERDSTLILCADDDYIYPPHFVSTYYRHHLLHPESVKGANCRRALFDDAGCPLPYEDWPKERRTVAPILGLWIIENLGCMVPCALMGQDFFSDEWKEACPTSGETWMNAYLWRRKIPVSTVLFRPGGFHKPLSRLTQHHLALNSLGGNYSLPLLSRTARTTTLTAVNLRNGCGNARSLKDTYIANLNDVFLGRRSS